MDKNILFVISDQPRATGKDLVSFHRSFRLVFNAEVLATTGIKKGWWANIRSVNKKKRTIEIQFTTDKEGVHSRKVGDPSFSKVTTEYLCIRSIQLLWEHDLCPLGAFDYSWFSFSKIMLIHF